jgi:hypothetical protein
MADIPQPSFIPKYNPAKATRRAATKKVYLFTVLSYVILFATLAAVGGLFFYSRLTTTELAAVIQEYNKKTAQFDVAAMDSVIEANERLRQTRELLQKTISIPTTLAILEAATIDTVQFESLTLRREDENRIQIETEIETDSFDSVLFQRSVYEKAESIAGITVSDVTINLNAGSGEEDAPRETRVQFSALFEFPSERLSVRATSTPSVVEPTGPGVQVVNPPLAPVATTSFATTSTPTTP